MRPWFEEYPLILENELQWLEWEGYKYEIDDDQRQAGRLVIRVVYPDNGQSHQLTVRYPDEYPSFIFQIFGESFPAGRHKDPYSGMLCLIKDPLQNWRPSKDTLAVFLKEQIPNILFAHRNPDHAQELEAPEARQITGQIPYREHSVVFTGDWTIPKEITHGTLLIGIEAGLNLKQPEIPLRGAILEIRDMANQLLEELEPSLKNRFQNTVRGRWVRLVCPPGSIADDRILDEAKSVWPQLVTPKYTNGLPDIVGLLIPEEVQIGLYEENWVIVVRRAPARTVNDRSGRKTIKTIERPLYLARADRISQHTIRARISRLKPIATKRVLIVGLGSIGSMISWQLARSGIGHLTLVDHDIVQTGNLPRWFSGLSAVGHPKSEYLASLLRNEYPYLTTASANWQIGDPRTGETSEITMWEKVLDRIDLVIDATAERVISAYLSKVSKDRGIPYLWATGTHGSFGGIVGRVVPGKTAGCWRCFCENISTNKIKAPIYEETPDIQTVGCFHPTFPGTGFDMDNVSLSAVRLAVSTLCASAEDAYPDFGWDVAVVNLFDAEKKPIAPHWCTYDLNRHSNCTICNG